jgi:hypothetical protein
VGTERNEILGESRGYLAVSMMPDTSMLKPAEDFRRCIARIWSPYDVKGDVRKNIKLKTSTHSLKVTIEDTFCDGLGFRNREILRPLI